LYSTTSRSSFKEVSRTCRQLPLDAKKDRNLVLILVGTKSDDKASREVTPEEGRALANELGCRAFFETSAKSGENVNDAVLAMVLALRKATKERKMDIVIPFLMIIRLISRFRGGGSRIKDAG
jgi:GTPase SAR1 family protein